MEPCFLVFDVGTTSIKCSQITADGRIVASHQVEYPLLTAGGDIAELDPETYWRGVVEGARVVVDRAAGRRVDAVGVCSQGETVVLLDDRARPLRNAIVWMDRRAQSQADRILASVGRLVETGTTAVDPAWTACKLLWVRENEPEVHRRISHVLLVQDFVIHRLTGELVGDYSLYPTTYLLDIYTRRWIPAVLDIVGIDERQLPRLLPPASVAGRLGQGAARALGLRPGLAVVAGGMDQTAAMVGAGNLAPGMITETTGGAMALCTTLTPEAVRAIRSAPSGSPSELPVQPHIVADTYLTTQWCPSGGMSLRWMRDNLYAAEAEADRQRGGDGYGPVTDAAARVPPGCEGLLFLPYMAGPGTVPVDGDVRGVYWGLELHHGRAHMARAVMESMGYLLRYLAERMVLAGLPCREIRLLGGGAKSPLWRQIKADVTGRPVASATCPEAASLGVAMECAVALGVHGTLDRAFGAMGALSQISHPSDPGRAAYEIAYMAFEALHRRIGRSYT